jgi:hypothetical protein
MEWRFSMKLIFVAGICSIFELVAAACDCGQIDLGGGSEPDAVDDGDGLMASDTLWAPPIDTLGETGWRDSEEPWCNQAQTFLNAYDLWSEPRAVYVLARDNPYSTCSSSDCVIQEAIYYNDGNGWEPFWVGDDTHLDMDYGVVSITGMPGGPIMAKGGIPPSNTGLRFIVDGVATYQEGLESIGDIFTVNENLVYAIMSDKIISYDRITWSALVLPPMPYWCNFLWADEENLFCGGDRGTMLSLEEGEWKMHDTRSVLLFGPLWGFGGSDVWVVEGGDGLRHFDGETWAPVEWPCLDSEDEGHCVIKGLWGMNGILFFYTRWQLVRHDGTGFQTLFTAGDGGAWPGAEIRAMWGNSPSEVFIAVSDEGIPRPDCGIYYLLWWDGSEFHWF